jgi:hypothetical protein
MGRGASGVVIASDMPDFFAARLKNRPVPITSARMASKMKLPTASQPARRILAVLEGRSSDSVVCARAIAAAEASGGQLTLVAVVPRPFPNFNSGIWCVPPVPKSALREHAEFELGLAVVTVPSGIPFNTSVHEGSVAGLVSRGEHDLIVMRRRARSPLSWPKRQPLSPILELTVSDRLDSASRAAWLRGLLWGHGRAPGGAGRRETMPEHDPRAASATPQLDAEDCKEP